MLENPKIKRLQELNDLEYPSQDDLDEIEQLKKELNLVHNKDPNQYESIGPIKQFRKLRSKNLSMQSEASVLEEERKQLELQLKIKREKERIEAAKNKLDGKIFCDDCKKWVYRSHFDK